VGVAVEPVGGDPTEEGIELARGDGRWHMDGERARHNPARAVCDSLKKKTRYGQQEGARHEPARAVCDSLQPVVGAAGVSRALLQGSFAVIRLFCGICTAGCAARQAVTISYDQLRRGTCTRASKKEMASKGSIWLK